MTKRLYGINVIPNLFHPNEKGEAAGAYPRNQAELFTLASTRLLFLTE
jgi:hypothetical protein